MLLYGFLLAYLVQIIDSERFLWLFSWWACAKPTSHSFHAYMAQSPQEDSQPNIQSINSEIWVRDCLQAEVVFFRDLPRHHSSVQCNFQCTCLQAFPDRPGQVGCSHVGARHHRLRSDPMVVSWCSVHRAQLPCPADHTDSFNTCCRGNTCIQQHIMAPKSCSYKLATARFLRLHSCAVISDRLLHHDCCGPSRHAVQ